MATPVLQNINAFSVNEGTAIFFNMVGNSQSIQSNKIIIYSSNDEQICSHIQNTREYKHDFPNKNNTSIVYVSGKKSEFVNNKSFSAIIEVYDGLNATGHLVGTSQRVQFWCLEYPILTFISPSTTEDGIESTYYKFEASVECNIGTHAVLNRVQYCKFDLYKVSDGINVLIDSSDTIYGKGAYAGAGTSLGDLYILEYQFEDIENGEYFTRLTITTEQGMIESLDSSHIIISLKDTAVPLIEVYNNCEDGSIDIDYIITNIEGQTNLEDEEYDGSISLLEDGTYLVWGRKTDESGNLSSQLEFPMTLTEYGNVSNWSLVIKADTLIHSNSNPFVQNDHTYICRLSDILGSEGIYLYSRKIDEDNIKLVLYVVNDNIGSNVSVIESNTVSADKLSSQYYEILIVSYNGWYSLSIDIV